MGGLCDKRSEAVKEHGCSGNQVRFAFAANLVVRAIQIASQEPRL